MCACARSCVRAFVRACERKSTRVWVGSCMTRLFYFTLRISSYPDIGFVCVTVSLFLYVTCFCFRTRISQECR